MADKKLVTKVEETRIEVAVITEVLFKALYQVVTYPSSNTVVSVIQNIWEKSRENVLTTTFGKVAKVAITNIKEPKPILNKTTMLTLTVARTLFASTFSIAHKRVAAKTNISPARTQNP